jgi:hypothetical protein
MNPLERYSEIKPIGWENINQVPEIGKALKYANHLTEADECFQICVQALLALIEAKRLEDALWMEVAIYNAFVKTTESEEHYKKCFDLWSPQLKAYGKSHRRPLKPGDPRSVCFVIHNGVLLGHTEVMITFIDEWRRQGIDTKLHLCSIGGMDPKFSEMMTTRGVTIIPNPGLAWGGACFHLRDEIEKRGINTAVWLGPPITASFALSMKLAHRQVIWSVKFHPVYFDREEITIQPIATVQ